jgi:hypothetical protein
MQMPNESPREEFKVLRQSVGDFGKIEYFYHREGLASCLILRHKSQFYRFRSGTFIENEEYNDPEYFRSSGSVERYRKVEGNFGDEHGFEVQEAFFEFVDMLYDEDNSHCSARINQKAIEICWSYKPAEFECEDLKMTSGRLCFLEVIHGT